MKSDIVQFSGMTVLPNGRQITFNASFQKDEHYAATLRAWLELTAPILEEVKKEYNSLGHN